MRRWLLVVAFAAVYCGAECIVLDPVRYGRIEVALFDSFGKPVPVNRFELTEYSTGKKLTFRGGVVQSLPYGSYTLQAWAPGFRSLVRQVRLDQPLVAVRAHLSIAVECRGFATVRGTVSPAPRGREIWVKLVPVVGSGGGETKIGADGTFLVSGLDDGDYFLLVVDGKRILHSRVLEGVVAIHEVLVDVGRY
jgi:hypothetical protein